MARITTKIRNMLPGEASKDISFSQQGLDQLTGNVTEFVKDIMVKAGYDPIILSVDLNVSASVLAKTGGAPVLPPDVVTTQTSVTDAGTAGVAIDPGAAPTDAGAPYSDDTAATQPDISGT